MAAPSSSLILMIVHPIIASTLPDPGRYEQSTTIHLAACDKQARPTSMTTQAAPEAAHHHQPSLRTGFSQAL